MIAIASLVYVFLKDDRNGALTGSDQSAMRACMKSLIIKLEKELLEAFLK